MSSSPGWLGGSSTIHRQSVTGVAYCCGVELSTVDNTGGRWALIAQMGLVVLAGFSLLILVSFGGQFVVAPGLLPVQWMVARWTDGWVSKTFAVLGGLLLLEVVPLSAVVLLGDSLPVWLAGLAVAIAGAAAFYRTSRSKR
jgi:hypothetical protein